MLHLIKGLADDEGRFRLEGTAITSQGHGVDAIGLGQLANAFGKAPGLARVELDGCKAGCIEGPFEVAMVSPGGFEYDTLDNPGRKPGNQGAKRATSR
ncbi:hypothetical protein GCM10007874_00710 [Labrys miyagiensis]|uniref:Uncharacterized protein n=1 Tax=Labrys miyagiensis TaxID=346912 RepID=A0ABQ6C9V0_9HYPH|nr:hypothetical protein GCM10007874_00710 [Labrys miyagiensis]